MIGGARVSALRKGAAIGLAVLGTCAFAGGAASQGLAPDQLFRQAAPSIYTVVAVDSADDLKAKKDVKQGSAVALTPDLAVTNCHVVRERKLVFLLHEKRAHPASIAHADERADICLLRPAKLKLEPVARIRAYGDLQVGQRVYAIGTPRGLERSLSEGLISGLRQRNGVKVVQMTAPISPGSSGGGLFDAEGHLVGVTSYFQAENFLSFAVATDLFWPLPPPSDSVAAAPQPAPPPQAAAGPTTRKAVRLPLAPGEVAACGPIAIRGIAVAKDKTKCVESGAGAGQPGATAPKHELAVDFDAGLIAVAAERFTAGFRAATAERMRSTAEKWTGSAARTAGWSEVIEAPYPHVRFQAVYPRRTLSCAMGQFARGGKEKGAGIGVWLGYCETGAEGIAEDNLATVFRVLEIKD